MGDSLTKLLLVEDDKQLGEMYAKKFNKNGYEVTLVKDGATGLSKTHSENFDVVVLDIMLPGLSGIEALGMIRSERKTAKTPVIIYTNYGDQSNREKCLTYGADEFILKVDTTPESLCETIGRILTEKKIEKV